MSHVHARPASSRIAPLLILSAVFLAAGFVFRGTLHAMWSVWRSSESFAHGPLIPIAVLWLVWRKRGALTQVPLAPWWPGAIWVALGVFGWMLGNLAGVNTVEQLALVAVVPGLIALVLGWRAAWTIAFPLCFLVFAVPFGTQMLPTLMDWTADFTVMAVKLSGIPVHREGTSFTLPSGAWSVVESCSGIRYLLAAVPLAFLYSYLSYRSYLARIKFIVLTILVALVANWVRAYIIVMLGHLSNMRIAVGADHLVYGWIFFGIVMAITFSLGAYIRDGAPAAQAKAAEPGAGTAFDSRSTPEWPTLAAAATGLAIMVAAPLASHALRGDAEAGHELARLAPILQELPAPADPDRTYRPHYTGALESIGGSSRSDPQTHVMVLRYARQDGTGEMIHEGNRVMPGKPDDSTWQIRARRTAQAGSLGTTFPPGPVNEYVISGPDGHHLVWEWFQVGDAVHASPSLVKLETAWAMLRGRGDESLAWFLWTRLDGPIQDARNRLAAEAGRLGTVRLETGR